MATFDEALQAGRVDTARKVVATLAKGHSRKPERTYGHTLALTDGELRLALTEAVGALVAAIEAADGDAG